jgi:hypothetical protein
VKTSPKTLNQRQILKGVDESAKTSLSCSRTEREKFLERNRLAASQCREKKQQYIGRVKERTGSYGGQIYA